jgi:hypothetical protein
VIIRKWRKRFSENGLVGLQDAPRSGKPATVGFTFKARVIKRATKKPKNGYPTLSQRRIAEEVKAR